MSLRVQRAGASTGAVATVPGFDDALAAASLGLPVASPEWSTTARTDDLDPHLLTIAAGLLAVEEAPHRARGLLNFIARPSQQRAAAPGGAAGKSGGGAYIPAGGTRFLVVVLAAAYVVTAASR